MLRFVGLVGGNVPGAEGVDMNSKTFVLVCVALCVLFGTAPHFVPTSCAFSWLLVAFRFGVDDVGDGVGPPMGPKIFFAVAHGVCHFCQWGYGHEALHHVGVVDGQSCCRC